MGFEPDGFDFGQARYHKVCIVAPEGSPVRDWVVSFFAEAMAALVASEGLHGCTPPFDRRRAVVIRPPA
jgi:DNA gyrase/topoisomerase IV subunit B